MNYFCICKQTARGQWPVAVASERLIELWLFLSIGGVNDYCMVKHARVGDSDSSEIS